MSAKINIETDNPALASALGMLIAKAIIDAGFTNTMAKHVMISSPMTLWPTEHVPEPVQEMRREPPVLGPMILMLPPTGDDFIGQIEALSPGTLQKPIVLEAWPDTCETYETAAEGYLTSVSGVQS